MADFEGSLPIKTARDDDVKIKIVSWAAGETATAGWDIDSNGAGLVRATSFDIRPLSDATDSIAVSGSVTVSATDLDIRDLVFATDKVDVSGSSVTVSATALDIRPLVFATDTVDVSGSSVTVSATALDTRDLTVARDTVKIGEGANVLGVNADGSINVSLVPGARVAVNHYGTATINKNASHAEDYVVPDDNKFTATSILVGCRGATKVEYGTYNGTTFTPYGTYFQLPAQNRIMNIPALNLLGNDNDSVRVIVTNLDNTGDVYVTIQGENEPV